MLDMLERPLRKGQGQCVKSSKACEEAMKTRDRLSAGIFWRPFKALQGKTPTPLKDIQKFLKGFKNVFKRLLKGFQKA